MDRMYIMRIVDMSEQLIKVGNEMLTKEQLRERINAAKETITAQKSLLDADKAPLLTRKAELEKEISDVTNDRKAELDKVIAQKTKIESEISEATKDFREELTAINTDISEIDKELQEMGVNVKPAGVRRAKGDGKEKWKERVDSPQWKGLVELLKREGRFASKEALMKAIKNEPNLGGVNDEATMMWGNMNYCWIGVRKMNIARVNTDGSIEYIGNQ